MLLSSRTASPSSPSAPAFGNLNEEADGDSPLPYDKVLGAAWDGLLITPQEEKYGDATAIVEGSSLTYDEGCEEEMEGDSEEKLMSQLQAESEEVDNVVSFVYGRCGNRVQNWGTLRCQCELFFSF